MRLIKIRKSTTSPGFNLLRSHHNFLSETINPNSCTWKTERSFDITSILAPPKKKNTNEKMSIIHKAEMINRAS